MAKESGPLTRSPFLEPVGWIALSLMVSELLCVIASWLTPLCNTNCFAQVPRLISKLAGG